MGGLSVLSRARLAGLRVEMNGDGLVVRGPRRLDALAREVLAHKAEVIERLAAQVEPAKREAVAKVTSVDQGGSGLLRHFGKRPNSDSTLVKIIIDHNTPVSGPVQVARWLTVADPARSVAADLRSLAVAIEHANAGTRSAYTELVDEYVERLAACGCVVRLEPIR